MHIQSACFLNIKHYCTMVKFIKFLSLKLNFVYITNCKHFVLFIVFKTGKNEKRLECITEWIFNHKTTKESPAGQRRTAKLVFTEDHSAF